MKPTECSLSGADLSAWCPHFDHHDPALTHDNVYQVYEHLRQDCPVAWSERYGGFWVVSRYGDIVTALMDPVTFSSTEGVHLPRQESQQKSIPIDYDPPIHTLYRKIFTDALNVRLIRGREPFIRSVIVHLLAPIAAKRHPTLAYGSSSTSGRGLGSSPPARATKRACGRPSPPSPNSERRRPRSRPPTPH